MYEGEIETLRQLHDQGPPPTDLRGLVLFLIVLALLVCVGLLLRPRSR